MICDNETSLETPTGAVRRVQIGHARVHSCDFEEMADLIVRAAIVGEPKYVVTPNAQHVVLLAKDESLRTIYSEAAFVLPDGASLLLAARILGQEIHQRIAGVDMFAALCQRDGREGLRVFLLGGRPGSAEAAAAKLLANNPGLVVSGTCCPPLGFENDQLQQRDIEDRIRAARPHLLFVAFGAPKQERWIYEHARNLGVPVAMGVGGSFEMVGGVVPRAPMWLQRIGSEWLYRLLREPSRMWRRYLIGNLQFANIVLRQRLDSKTDDGSSARRQNTL
jgi:N-acetylglucosaminyldiphosphoundecaprenol N-acetyl-beta-D-mannosaminyltransferase